MEKQIKKSVDYAIDKAKKYFGIKEVEKINDWDFKVIDRDIVQPIYYVPKNLLNASKDNKWLYVRNDEAKIIVPSWLALQTRKQEYYILPLSQNHMKEIDAEYLQGFISTGVIKPIRTKEFEAQNTYFKIEK